MARTAKKKTSRKTARSGGEESVSPKGWIAWRIVWLTLAAAWCFVALALLTFSPGDAPSHDIFPHNDPASNLMGVAGAYTAYALLTLAGWGMVPAMLGWGVALGWTATGRDVARPLLRTAGVVVLVIGAAGFTQLTLPGSVPLAGMPGGMAGVAIAGASVPSLGAVGTALWLLVLLLAGALMTFDRPAVALAAAVSRAIAAALGRSASSAAENVKKKASKLKTAREGYRASDLDGAAAQIRRKVRGEPEEEEEFWEEDAEAEAEAEWEDDPEAEDGYEDEYDEAYEEEPEDEAAEYDGAEEDDDEQVGAPQVFDRDKLKEKMAALPVRFASTNRGSASAEDLEQFQQHAELEGYRFPGLDLLEEPDEGFDEKLEESVREQAAALEEALDEYRIKGSVEGIESGPVITLFHVKLAPGTKVATLSAVSSDLARSLKSVNVRIVPNMAGRDTVGIEVPNLTKEKVRLKELMGRRELFEKMNLPMFLGKDAAGDPLIADLTKMPHVLIAGTTGSGKSVCMNTIIMSFMYTKKPSELRLVLVDPKMVEMSQFKDIPHLMCPVVTEMAKAAAILEWAVGKMDERYELLVEAGCRDITSYNELTWEELKERFEPANEHEEARIPRKLPYMVFIIDELADLMMTNKEVEGSIIRIAQKARAVGIHLILATQRPQANVVTGLIKGNMPCRITFKVASGLDSRIVLDQKGGELLLGQGDMLFLSPSSHKLSRAQGTLVDDKEIRRVVKFLKEIASPSFERSLTQLRSPGDPDDERIVESKNNSSASLKAAQEDPMFDRAVEIVLETKRGSVSLLQRRLAIGYTRASRLIDLMGIAGIIGEHKGSVAREVLITEAEWDAIKAMHEEMRAQQDEQPSLFGEDDAAAEMAEAVAGESEVADEQLDEEEIGEEELDGADGAEGESDEDPPWDEDDDAEGSAEDAEEPEEEDEEAEESGEWEEASDEAEAEEEGEWDEEGDEEEEDEGEWDEEGEYEEEEWDEEEEEEEVAEAEEEPR
ncbi:MAG: DNA translocase FtsK 4TM domain-containing protein [Planctomycetota bacterium]